MEDDNSNPGHPLVAIIKSQKQANWLDGFLPKTKVAYERSLRTFSRFCGVFKLNIHGWSSVEVYYECMDLSDVELRAHITTTRKTIEISEEDEIWILRKAAGLKKKASINTHITHLKRYFQIVIKRNNKTLKPYPLIDMNDSTSTMSIGDIGRGMGGMGDIGRGMGGMGDIGRGMGGMGDIGRGMDKPVVKRKKKNGKKNRGMSGMSGMGDIGRGMGGMGDIGRGMGGMGDIGRGMDKPVVKRKKKNGKKNQKKHSVDLKMLNLTNPPIPKRFAQYLYSPEEPAYVAEEPAKKKLVLSKTQLMSESVKIHAQKPEVRLRRSIRKGKIKIEKVICGICKDIIANSMQNAVNSNNIIWCYGCLGSNPERSPMHKTCAVLLSNKTWACNFCAQK